MAARTLARKRDELSAFLTHHRRRLKPADVGLATTGRRRTPGLRREEVAALAGVGLTWYTWFEQGRDIRVSEAFLLSVAKALALSDAECTRLFLLAHRRPPPAEARRPVAVSLRVQALLNDLARPAYVTNLCWDVLAWSPAADALFGFSDREPDERNLLRMVFADAEFRRRLPDWSEDAPRLLAQFRHDLAAAPEDEGVLDTIADLGRLSPDFRRWMAKPSMERSRRGIASLVTRAGRRVRFSHEMLVADVDRHLRMVVYFENDASCDVPLDGDASGRR